MLRRASYILAVVLALTFVAAVIVGVAQAAAQSACELKLSSWLGCIISAHENLAAGIIGGGVTLLAAAVAWLAVQQQINADRARATADRLDAERILAEDLTHQAQGMAAAWRCLVALPDDADRRTTWPAREAAAYMAQRLTRPELIANYRAMVNILTWERRIAYSSLLLAIDELSKFQDPEAIDPIDDCLNVIRSLADEFEICLPATADFFEGLWRRSPKAMDFADYIGHIAGYPPPDEIPISADGPQPNPAE